MAHARAHLLYGEWLAAEHRRADSRRELKSAHELFAASGAEAFATRAARGLGPAGRQTRARRAGGHGGLTDQEAAIARLARDGLTNPEIGARLFISPRTVQYHLHKVFGKLGVSSRTELGVALEE
jgi:DNA-binding NarL/FixJ family response regulator